MIWIRPWTLTQILLSVVAKRRWRWRAWDKVHPTLNDAWAAFGCALYASWIFNHPQSYISYWISLLFSFGSNFWHFLCLSAQHESLCQKKNQQLKKLFQTTAKLLVLSKNKKKIKIKKRYSLLIVTLLFFFTSTHTVLAYLQLQSLVCRCLTVVFTFNLVS